MVSVLGLGRDIVTARYIGVTVDFDCFVAAFSVISFFIVLFNQQNVQSWYMADYHGSRLKDEAKATQLKLKFSGYLFLIVLLIAILLYFFSAPLFKVLYPYLGDVERETAIHLFHIMLPVMVLNSTLGVFQSYYHSKDRYLYPALGQLLNSLLIFVLLFVTQLTVEWLAYTYLIGMFSCWLFTLFPILPSLKASGSSSKANTVKLVLFGRYIVAVSIIDQIIQLWYRTLYAKFGDGALSEFGYASKLIFFPIYLVGFSISTAVLPKITTEIKNSNYQGYHITTSAHLTLFLLFLSSSFVGLFSGQIPAVLFKSNLISLESMAEIKNLLFMFAIFISTTGFSIFLSRIIHLLKASKPLMIAVLVCSIFQMMTTTYGMNFFGAQAIPVMATIWSLILVGIQLKIIRSHGFKIIHINDVFIIVAITMLPCAFVYTLTSTWPDSFLNLLCQGSLCFIMAIGLYYKTHFKNQTIQHS